MGALDRVGIETTPDMADGGRILPVKEVGMAGGGYLDPGYDLDIIRRAPDSPLDLPRTTLSPQPERDLAPRARPVAELPPAEIKPSKASLRERHAAAVQDFLRSKGVDNYQAAKIAQTVIGGPQSNLPIGIGLSDFPLLSPYIAEESGHSLGEGQKSFKEGEYLPGALYTGAAALGALPVTRPAAIMARGAATGARAAGRSLAPKAAEMAEQYLQSAGMMPSVIKPKGGNWLTGSVEKSLEPLKSTTIAGETPAQRIPRHEQLLQDPSLTAESRATVERQLNRTKQEAAVDNWIDTKLNKYIRNEMGTPEDPVRKLAEQGKIHFETPYVEPTSKVEENRKLFAQKNNNKWGYGQSQLAQNWEDAADKMLNVISAESIQSMNPATFNRNWPGMEWIHKLDPETPIYGLNRGVSGFGGRDPSIESLGFSHLVDELRNATRPDSDLPVRLRWKPEDLSKVTMEQAVERVAKINEWRAAQKAEADAARAANPATAIHKEYPTIPGTEAPNEKGLRWVELKQPEFKSFEQLSPEAQSKYRQYLSTGVGEEAALRQATKHDNALAEALKYEGETMGHCVGGYCPDVLEGKSRIFSLRDKKGEPHVTIEVNPKKTHPRYSDIPEDVNEKLIEEGTRLGNKRADDLGYSPYGYERDLERRNAISNLQDDWSYNNPIISQDIIQIKGKANKAPKEEYLPFVQDFVRGGKWGEVRDLKNANLIPIDPSSELAAALSKTGKPVPGYVTQDELTNLLKWNRGEGELPSGFAKGGFVQDTDALVERLMATGLSKDEAMQQALRMANAKEEAHMQAGGLLSKLAKVTKEAHPLVMPPVKALTKEEIRPIAQRVSEQMTGEFVRPDPKLSVNPAGKSQKVFEREKSLPVEVVEKVQQKPAPAIDYEKQQGKVLVGVPGDPTIGGVAREGTLGSVHEGAAELRRLGDVTFEHPVELFGGPRYGAYAPDETFWASNIAGAKPIQNRIEALAELHEAPVLGKYIKMSPESTNFALHNLDALLAYQQPEKLSPSKMEMLNRQIRNGSPKYGKFPGFAGFEDPIDVLLQSQLNSGLRKHIAETLMKPSITDKLGMRPGSDVLFGITEPELRNLETGISGFSIGEMKPKGALTPSAHPTYEHDIPGTFLGQSKYPTPYEIAFPASTGYVRSQLKPGVQEFNMLKLVGPREKIDQQYIDQMKMYEELMKEYTGKKKGGLVKPDGADDFAEQVKKKMAGGGLIKKALTKAKEVSKVAEVPKEPFKETWAGYATREEWEAKQARDQEQNKRIAEAWKRVMEQPMQRNPSLTENQIPRVIQTSGYNPRGWMGYPTQEAYEEAMKLKASKDAIQNAAIADAWKKRVETWPSKPAEKETTPVLDAFPTPDWKTRFSSIK